MSELKPLVIGDLVVEKPIIQGGMGVGISLHRLAAGQPHPEDDGLRLGGSPAQDGLQNLAYRNSGRTGIIWI